MSSAATAASEKLCIEVLEVTPFAQNCSIVWSAGSKNCIVIDPGGDVDAIEALLESQQLTPSEIWLTHSHLDHCGGVAALLRTFPNLPVRGHPNERFLREHVVELAKQYGLGRVGFENCPEPTVPLQGGEELAVGDHKAKVLFVPGHSPGHLCFWFEQSKLLIAGDTLFAGSIGRTDIPGGDHSQLITGIKREILTLPEDTIVYPGHGPTTSVGRERVANPFLR